MHRIIPQGTRIANAREQVYFNALHYLTGQAHCKWATATLL